MAGALKAKPERGRRGMGAEAFDTKGEVAAGP